MWLKGIQGRRKKIWDTLDCDSKGCKVEKKFSETLDCDYKGCKVEKNFSDLLTRHWCEAETNHFDKLDFELRKTVDEKEFRELNCE